MNINLLTELAEFRRCFFNEFAKLFVEMTQVIESAIVTDIHNVQISVQKQFAGIIDFDLIQIFKNS